MLTNDLFANLAVIRAALLVSVTHTIWPDVLVGLAIAALFQRRAADVLRESVVHLRAIAPQSGDRRTTERPTHGAQCEAERTAAASRR